MKTLVIYYSLEGNTKYVAEKIAKQIHADLLELKPEKAYPTGKVSKFFWGGRSVVFGDTPKLMPYNFNSKAYDKIIIGTPVWAGSFTPPIKTFIKENDLSKKKVALFACHAGGGADKCFDRFKKILQNEKIVATLSLINPKIKQTEDDLQKIKAFCREI